jgi:hypothetical protein
VKLCDGSRSVDEIIATIASVRARAPFADIDRDVRQLIARLSEKNLIE